MKTFFFFLLLGQIGLFYLCLVAMGTWAARKSGYSDGGCLSGPPLPLTSFPHWHGDTLRRCPRREARPRYLWVWGEGSRRQRTGWETASMGPRGPLTSSSEGWGRGPAGPPEGWVLRGFEFPHTALQIQEAGQHFHFIPHPTPHTFSCLFFFFLFFFFFTQLSSWLADSS